MQINELEMKTGLDRATIRFYEKEGMITPTRLENGYRDYSDEDLQQLLKIKLLRQLGVSLLKIKDLQQGSEDFQEVLREQIAHLEKQRDSAQRSSQVCKLMQTDRVTYSSMDPNYYLEKFRTTQLVYPQNPVASTKPSSPFQEDVPVEFHPWRRYFARHLDLSILLTVIMFVQIVFLRTRLETILIGGFLLMLLWIPLEALCYTLFGTTPGKFAFGIQVERADGRKHSFISGIKRAFCAYRYGMGWGIPIWELWRKYKSYKNYKEGWDNEWNEDSEISFFQFYYWRDLWRPVVVYATLIAMIITSICMLNTPKYNGKDLTMQQFVANYNSYMNPEGGTSEFSLNEDGTYMGKLPSDGYDITIDFGNGRIDDDYPDLEYIMEGDRVCGFSCTDKFFYTGTHAVFEHRYRVAIMALLAAQPGETTDSASEFIDELIGEIRKSIHSMNKTVMLENDRIAVTWKIQYDRNTEIMDAGTVFMLQQLVGNASQVETYIRVELK